MKLKQIRRRAKTKWVSVLGMTFVRLSRTKRCKTYEAGCPVCDEWKFYDVNGRFAHTFDELRSFMDTTEKEQA